MEGGPLSTRAYKFLRPGAVGPFSGFAWPVPADGRAGEWVAATTEDGPCRAGVHACERDHLPLWIWEELWEADLAGEVEQVGHKLRAPRGRLVRRIETWSPEAAKSFAVACAERAALHASEPLRTAGYGDAASAFEDGADLPGLRELTAVLWDELPHETRIPVGMASDGALRALTATASDDPYVSAHGSAVCAYIAALTALRVSDEAALAQEREWQADRLARELALDLALAAPAVTNLALAARKGMEQRAGKEVSHGLEPLPGGFAATAAALHRVAEEIVAPARKPDNEIALQETPGGFGTPPFGYDGEEHQVRVEADELVYTVGGEERRTTIASLAEAGALVADLLPDEVSLDAKQLEVDRSAAQALGAWYALGDAVLEELIAEAVPGDDPSTVNLWPEHFDLAIELGPDADGARANYGFSPGDENHPEPYLYVGPWTAKVEGELWNARGFAGAELRYAELLGTADPYRATIDFCRTRKQALKEGMSG